MVCSIKTGSSSFYRYLYYIPPILTILLVPPLMERYSTIVSLGLFCVVLFLGLIRRGYTMEILSIVLCIPSMVAIYENEAVNIKQFNILLVLFPYIFFLIFFFNRKFNKLIPSEVGKWRNYSIFFLLLTLVYAFVVGSFSIYVPNELTYVCMTMCFFMIAYYDKQSLKDQLDIIDILFYITCIFVVIQYVFQYSPYNWAYLQFERRITDAFRASGLLGNSLTLSCFILFYECFLLVRYDITKRFPWVRLFLCFIIGLMTVSRTTLVLSISQVFIWMFLTKRLTSIKSIIVSLILLGTTIYFLQNMLPETVEALFDRIENDNVNHRTASYGTVFNLFLAHPFGVGGDYLQVINREHLYTDGFIRDMPTFDNYFLTAIAKYGVFALFVYYFDYYLLFKVIKLRKEYRRILSFVLLFFILRSLIGLSYNVESYLIFNIPFFIYLAIIIKWNNNISSYDYYKNTI